MSIMGIFRQLPAKMAVVARLRYGLEIVGLLIVVPERYVTEMTGRFQMRNRALFGLERLRVETGRCRTRQRVRRP